MPWRLLPNPHDGSCAYVSAAQLLGWGGNDADVKRLRDECALDVLDMVLGSEELSRTAIYYANNYSLFPSEVKWMSRFRDHIATMLRHGYVPDGFRETLARAIASPSNEWGDHFTLNLISKRYRLLFLIVDDNKISVMDSVLKEEIFDKNGDWTGVRIGFMLFRGVTFFDAICYETGDRCIASFSHSQMIANQYLGLAHLIDEVIAYHRDPNRRSPVSFPATMSALLASERYVPLEIQEQEERLAKRKRSASDDGAGDDDVDEDADEEDEEDEDAEEDEEDEEDETGDDEGAPFGRARDSEWRVRIGIAGGLYRSVRTADNQFYWRIFEPTGPISYYPEQGPQQWVKDAPAPDAPAPPPFKIQKPKSKPQPKPKPESKPKPIAQAKPPMTIQDLLPLIPDDFADFSSWIRIPNPVSGISGLKEYAVKNVSNEPFNFVVVPNNSATRDYLLINLSMWSGDYVRIGRIERVINHKNSVIVVCRKK